MTGTTMTLPFTSEARQFFAEMISRHERFVRLCNTWTSAEALSFDLAQIGYEASPRTCQNWRNRTTKKVPYNAVQAVKYLAEHKKLKEAKDRSERIAMELEGL